MTPDDGGDDDAPPHHRRHHRRPHFRSVCFGGDGGSGTFFCRVFFLLALFSYVVAPFGPFAAATAAVVARRKKNANGARQRAETASERLLDERRRSLARSLARRLVRRRVRLVKRQSCRSACRSETTKKTRRATAENCRRWPAARSLAGLLARWLARAHRLAFFRIRFLLFLSEPPPETRGNRRASGLPTTNKKFLEIQSSSGTKFALEKAICFL